MALVGNGVRYRQNPGRFLGAPSIGGDLYEAGGVLPITRRYAFGAYASIPAGKYPPQAWSPPQKVRDAASQFQASLAMSTRAAGAMGIQTTANATATITTSALGQLIVSAIGTTSLTLTATGLLAAVQYAIGSANITVTAEAVREALAWINANTAISIDAALESYAIGKMSGLAVLAGQPPSDVNYNGAVYVADFGVDSSVYPAGTASNPVKTLAAADVIAEKYGLRVYYLNGTYTLTKDHTHTQYIGWGPLASCTLILDGDHTLEECKFTSLIITGTQNSLFPPAGFAANLGTEQFEKCYIYGVQNLSGNFFECQFAGPITIRAGKWISAQAAVIEGDTTVFDLQSTPNTTISMDVTSGWFQLINSVAGCLVELNVKGGEVSLYSSCVGGEYYLEGVGTLFNESAMTKKENHFVWDEDATYVNTPGSMGAKVNAAGAASNPWDTPEGKSVVNNTGLVPATL